MEEPRISRLGPIYGSLFLECASVALVSCVDERGRPNIITCSAIYPIQPGYVAVSVGFTRYSHDLIKESGEFVVNLPTEELQDAVDFCGSRSGRDHKKFEECRLTSKAARKVRAPIIGECVAWMKCRNVSSGVTHDHTVFIGEVVSAYAREEAVDLFFDPGKSLNK